MENIYIYSYVSLGFSYFLTGSSVRQRVVVFLKGKFKTIDEAEEEYGLSVESYLGQDAENVHPQPDNMPPHLMASVDHLGQSQLEALISKAFLKITDQKGLVVELTTKSPLLKHLGSLLEDLYKQLPDIKKDLLLDRLFLQRATDLGIDSNPGDYATLSMKAMLKLQEKGKPNLVYKWSRCLYNEELEGKPSLDFDRMPFGLIQYSIEFFSCTHVSQVGQCSCC